MSMQNMDDDRQDLQDAKEALQQNLQVASLTEILKSQHLCSACYYTPSHTHTHTHTHTHPAKGRLRI